MKTSELEKILKYNGCYFLEHGKKHDHWFSPITRKKVPIPRHRTELRPGTANAILKEAGIR